MLLDGRKVAGILAEGRPQEGWAVLGIGVNVAVRPEDLPPELHATAGDAGPRARATSSRSWRRCSRRWSARLALPAERRSSTPGARATRSLGRAITWAGGAGTAAGIDGEGRLVVELPDGGRDGRSTPARCTCSAAKHRERDATLLRRQAPSVAREDGCPVGAGRQRAPADPAA